MSIFTDLLYKPKTPKTPKIIFEQTEKKEECGQLKAENPETPRGPDTFEGKPCCFLPQETPERLRGILPPDLQGMGIPMQGLPLILRGISACGWTLENGVNGLEIRKSRQNARNAEGVLGYFRVHRKGIEKAFFEWKELLPLKLPPLPLNTPNIQKRPLELENTATPPGDFPGMGSHIPLGHNFTASVGQCGC